MKSQNPFCCSACTHGNDVKRLKMFLLSFISTLKQHTVSECNQVRIWFRSMICLTDGRKLYNNRCLWRALIASILLAKVVWPQCLARSWGTPPALGSLSFCYSSLFSPLTRDTSTPCGWQITWFTQSKKRWHVQWRWFHISPRPHSQTPSVKIELWNHFKYLAWFLRSTWTTS